MIGPLLDRLQRGRRAALAVSFAGRAVLAVVMAFGYDSWVLYPAALGAMVLSKSFVVLKAAVTPRVLPEAITLVTTNSRLTTFGLASGAVFGGVAAGVAAAVGLAGRAVLHRGCWPWRVSCCACGSRRGSRSPRARCRRPCTSPTPRPAPRGAARRRERTPMGRAALVALWGNGATRVLTGFLTLFVAFVVKAQTETEPTRQLVLIGVVGAAAGAGVVRRQRDRLPSAVRATPTRWSCPPSASPRPPRPPRPFLPGIGTAAVAALIAATCSALAKVVLDAVVQRDLPERSRASAFGRSETVLQLAWVFGGALGVLLPHDTFRLGFGIVAGVLVLVGVQTALVGRGRTLLPFLGPSPTRRRPTDRESCVPARESPCRSESACRGT